MISSKVVAVVIDDSGSKLEKSFKSTVLIFDQDIGFSVLEIDGKLEEQGIPDELWYSEDCRRKL